MAAERRLEPEARGLRSPVTCIAPGFFIVVALAVGGGLMLVNCLRAAPATSYTTRADAVPTDAPLFLSTYGVYLIRGASGVVALDYNEPRPQNPDQTCIIRWRETVESGGRRGFLRSDCTGALYDLEGAPVDGRGPPLRRHPVANSGQNVTVDLRRCIAPDEANASVSCKPRAGR